MVMLLAWLKPAVCSVIYLIFSNMFADYNRTSDGWIEWRGSQYLISRFTADMEGARRYCQNKHSDLVTINSVAESVFLWKLVSSDICTSALTLLISIVLAISTYCSVL